MTEVFLILGVFLLLAKIFGEVSERLGLTSLVGEITAGILIGPVLGLSASGAFFEAFAFICIAVLLFMSGLRVRYEDVSENIYTAGTLAATGGFLSFFLSFLAGFFFFRDVLVALAIGIIMISTSDATVFLMLTKLNKFKSSIGRIIIATNIADDVVSILSLSFFTVFIVHRTIPYSDIFKLFLISVGFYLFILTAGTRLFNRLLGIAGLFRSEQALFSLPLGIMLIVSVFTENIGIGFATGAFVAGMSMAKSRFSETVIAPKISVIAGGFLLPAFFAIIGSMLTFRGVNVMFVLLLLAAAAAGKFVGAGLMSRFFGVSGRNTRLMGIMMMPRGDSNIVIAQIALLLGVISGEIYSSVIFSIILTIILTPVLLRLFVEK